MIETFGGTIHPSPSPSPSQLTEAGRRVLAADPDSPGSLGIAISEAVEVAAQHTDTNYALGSVLNHVLLHQTIIGEEALCNWPRGRGGAGPDRRLHDPVSGRGRGGRGFRLIGRFARR